MIILIIICDDQYSAPWTQNNYFIRDNLELVHREMFSYYHVGYLVSKR